MLLPPATRTLFAKMQGQDTENQLLFLLEKSAVSWLWSHHAGAVAPGGEEPAPGERSPPTRRKG